MATLQEMMNDFMVSDSAHVKTASKKAGTEPADDDDLAKLASDLGLEELFSKHAEEDEGKSDEGKDDDDEKEESSEDSGEDKGEGEGKTASFGGSVSLYAMLNGGTQEKTAEQEKTAWEEAMGRETFRAYDQRFGELIEKVAVDLAMGKVAYASPKGGSNRDNPHTDATQSQQSATDKPANAKKHIDTKHPVVVDEVAATNDKRTVGFYEKVRDPDIKKTAALRKAFLLANLEE